MMIDIYIKPGKFDYGMVLPSVLGDFRESFQAEVLSPLMHEGLTEVSGANSVCLGLGVVKR